MRLPIWHASGESALRRWSWLVFAFLYLPILLLIIYSFNASELSFVWGGFSFEWYGKLWDNTHAHRGAEEQPDHRRVTTALSVSSARSARGCSIATASPRCGRLSTLIFIPMVIPEVIMGVSL